MRAAEPRYVLQSPGLVENCVRLYVLLLEFNLLFIVLECLSAGAEDGVPAFSSGYGAGAGSKGFGFLRWVLRKQSNAFKS